MPFYGLYDFMMPQRARAFEHVRQMALIQIMKHIIIIDSNKVINETHRSVSQHLKSMLINRRLGISVRNKLTKDHQK